MFLKHDVHAVNWNFLFMSDASKQEIWRVLTQKLSFSRFSTKVSNMYKCYYFKELILPIIQGQIIMKIYLL